MVIFTVTSLKSFPKSLIMAKSTKEKMPEAKLALCLVEEKLHHSVANCEDFDHIILAKDLGDPEFHKNLFQYDALEGITSVKAQLFLYLLDYFKEEDKFIFLDTDTKIFSPFDEVEEMLDEAPILVTPHLLTEEKNYYGIEDNELTTLVYGVYNTAFIAIRRSEESFRFLEWWNKKLKFECFFDTDNGIFVDQRWIDLAVGYFHVQILKHPGYNVACWNFSTREVSSQNNQYFINGEPLRFFHFSGVSNGRITYAIQTYVPDQNNPIYKLIQNYKTELSYIENQHPKINDWSYDYFYNGEKINKKTRLKFRKNPFLRHKYENPFSKNNKSLF